MYRFEKELAHRTTHLICLSTISAIWSSSTNICYGSLSRDESVAAVAAVDDDDVHRHPIVHTNGRSFSVYFSRRSSLSIFDNCDDDDRRPEQPSHRISYDLCHCLVSIWMMALASLFYVFYSTATFLLRRLNIGFE